MATKQVEQVITASPADTIIIKKSGTTGWVVAVLILIVVIAAVAYAWMHYRHMMPAQSGATVQVNIPPPPALPTNNNPTPQNAPTNQ